MKRWLTDDPVGKLVMTVFGYTLTTGLMKPLESKPLWAHVVGAVCGFLIGIGLRSQHRKLTVIIMTAAGLCAPWAYPYLEAVFLGAIGYLIQPHAVMGWVIVLGVIGLPVGTIGALFIIGQVSNNGWKQYQTDIIFGARWRWRWVSHYISDLAPFCPDKTCQNPLSFRRSRWNYNLWELFCDRCNFSTTLPEDVNSSTIEDRVKKEIGRRIRTKEFKATIVSDEQAG